MVPLLSNSAAELDPIDISHSPTLLEVYIMPEYNVLSGKAWQRERGFRLEEKSRDRFFERHLSSNSNNIIIHQVRVV